MRSGFLGLRTAVPITMALLLAAVAWTQTTPQTFPPTSPQTAPQKAPSSTTDAQPAPGTAPVGGDSAAAAVNPDKVIEPGSQKIDVKPGASTM